MNFRLLLIVIISTGLCFKASAQDNPNPITIAVPFLTFSPDAKAAGLGDAGVASEADAYSLYWNPAKIARAKEDFQIGVSYSPWLANLIDDMGLLSVSGYKKVNENSGFGIAFTFFDQGEIQFTDSQGNLLENVSSRDLSLTAGYSLKVSPDLSLGANIKYINSNLTGNVSINGNPTKPGRTVAGELGLYYAKEQLGEPKPVQFAFGLMLQNIGGKLNYNLGNEAFIPANLKVGTRFTYAKDDFNKFNLLLDFNKLLVPTPDPEVDTDDISSLGAIFSSFGDAPGGFSEELSEFTTSAGAEYNYSNIFSARVGYYYLSPKKGDVQYFTTGLGLRLQDRYGLDVSYLIPTGGTNSPLANTYRIGLNILLGEGGKIKTSNERI